ncbi:C2H2 finger domain protein [Penicillium angulare]|uniref:C2H2 finger domain protein n=1 Tax=Penicillium angulare TaxID=116970 RepID=A0A9W9FIK5_9EURO|nr:C2H2 finger domain protein [Penicillium angulare]
MGVITGIRKVTRPYSLRYGAGSVLESSGSVSDYLRNLVMNHADTRTFLKFYLSRRISKNLPAIIRGLDPEEDFMRAACRMSRTIDPDRPQWLTTEQSTSVNSLPEIAGLIHQRDEISQSLERPLAKHKGTTVYENYRKLNRELTGAKKRAQDALLLQI